MKSLSRTFLLAVSLLAACAAADARPPSYEVRAQTRAAQGSRGGGATWDAVTDGAAVRASMLVSTPNGDVYAIGENTAGSLGLDPSVGTNWQLNDFVKVAPASLTSGAVKLYMSAGFASFIAAKDGTLWASGDNSRGAAGLGDVADARVFTKVPGISNVVKIFSGGCATYAITSDGTLWATGDNSHHERGAGPSSTTFQKVTMPFPPGVVATDVVASNYSSTVLDSQGNVWVVGANWEGTLGTGEPRDTVYADYTKVPYFNGNAIAIAATTNGRAVGVLTNDGVVHTTGTNGDPYLETARGVARTVYYGFAPAATGAKTLSSGHALVLTKGDGAVYAANGTQDTMTHDGKPGFFPWAVRPASKFGAGTDLFFVIKPDGSLWMSPVNGTGYTLTHRLFKAR